MSPDALLRALADGRPHSGEELARAFDVTRTAVWKSVPKLAAWGLEVHAVAGVGYRLERPIDLVDALALRAAHRRAGRAARRLCLRRDHHEGSVRDGGHCAWRRPQAAPTPRPMLLLLGCSAEAAGALTVQHRTVLAADLMEFVGLHCPHGPLESDPGDLMANGYRLTIGRPCGVVFTRWITRQEAAEDLAMFTRN